MVGPLALDQLIGVRVPASQPNRRELAEALAPAAQTSSLPSVGRLFAPRTGHDVGLGVGWRGDLTEKLGR